MVSIIVPIYNSILYIEECIQSLLHQTVDDLEIILIDDCSTDDVMSVIEPILAQYEGKKTIRVHRNEKNLGSSATRNLGIEMAKGEYIGFVDCDHFVAPDYIEQMLEGFSQGGNIGIVMSFLTKVRTVKGKYEFIPSNYENMETRLITSCHYAQEMWTGQLPNSIYGKIYRRSIFDRNKFRTDRISAGFSFFIEITDFIQRNEIATFVISKSDYCIRNDNWYDYMRHCKTTYFMERVYDLQNILALSVKNKLSFTSVIRKSFLLQLLSTIRLAATLGPNTKHAYSVLHSIIKEQSNEDVRKVLNKPEYKTFLKIKYLPFLFRCINARRIYNRAFNNWHHLPIPIFTLGDHLEVACVSKAASSHLKSILIYLNKRVWVLDQSLNIHMICEENNYFKSDTSNDKLVHFSVYMDPFRRLVSTFQDKLRGGNPYVYFNQLGMGKHTSFDAFMKYVRKELKKEDPLAMDIHIRPQILSLGDYNCDVIVPSQHLNDFLLENGIPIPPKEANVSKKPKDYSEFEPYRNEIMELYSCDYDILNNLKIYEPGKLIFLDR